MWKMISSGFAIYFIVWWVTLFVMLPIGIRSQHEDMEGERVPGTDPGAPIMPSMARRVLWTTAVSAVVYGIGAWAYYSGHLTIDKLSRLMGL